MIKHFGFLTDNRTFKTNDTIIRPLPDHSQIVGGLKPYENAGFIIKDSWIYPHSITPRYELPNTHGIEVIGKIHDDDVNFLITVFGFSLGIRLSPDGWGHFYKTYLGDQHSSALVGFTDTKKGEIEYILSKALDFCLKEDSQIKKHLGGVIYLFLAGQSYAQEFERFHWQYIVLDSIYRIALNKNLFPATRRQPKHPERVQKLCNCFGIPVPKWAQLNNQNQSILSEMRNALVHEAMWGEQVMGFAASDKIPLYEIQSLNERFILSLLKIQCGYLSQPVCDNRCVCALDIKF